MTFIALVADALSGFGRMIACDLAEAVPEDADSNAVGRAVVDVVVARPGQRPQRIDVDPASDGAAVTFAVMDRVREQFLGQIGFLDLLHPARTGCATEHVLLKFAASARRLYVGIYMKHVQRPPYACCNSIPA